MFKMLEWVPREEQDVEFDHTVVFGNSYDFFGLDCLAQAAKSGDIGFIVWPDRTVNSGRVWSLYSTFEGTLWFQKFTSESDAKSKAEEFLALNATTKEPQ